MEKKLGIGTRLLITGALLAGYFGIGCTPARVDATPSLIPTPTLVGPLPTAIATGIPGNGGYTGADGKCHIGPPDTAHGQNGCDNGQPILNGTIRLTPTVAPTGIPGNGGYTGTDGKCHIGPPDTAHGQNGCQNGQPILGGTGSN